MDLHTHLWYWPMQYSSLTFAPPCSQFWTSVRSGQRMPVCMCAQAGTMRGALTYPPCSLWQGWCLGETQCKSLFSSVRVLLRCYWQSCFSPRLRPIPASPTHPCHVCLNQFPAVKVLVCLSRHFFFFFLFCMGLIFHPYITLCASASVFHFHHSF